MDKPESEIEPKWCLLGNVVAEQKWGDGVGDSQLRAGTKHFVGGTKVYCIRPHWFGYDRMSVIGRHRGSRKLNTIVISTLLITNWRAKLIYHPEVLRRLNEAGRAWTSEEQVLEFVDRMIASQVRGT